MTPLDLLRTIARMTMNGEMGPEDENGLCKLHMMGQQEAYETINMMIHSARELVDKKGTCRHVRDINVHDPDTVGVVSVSIYKDDTSGGMFGVDSSYLQSLNENDPLLEPFNGTEVMEVKEQCEHEWTDVSNEVCEGGMVCFKPGCGAIKTIEDDEKGEG